MEILVLIGVTLVVWALFGKKTESATPLITRDTTIVQETSRRHRNSDKVAFINRAIALKRNIRITYQKLEGEVSVRDVIPRYVGLNRFQGKPFMGVRGYCTLRQAERVFLLDRIVKLAMV